MLLSGLCWLATLQCPLLGYHVHLVTLAPPELALSFWLNIVMVKHIYDHLQGPIL